MPLLKIGFSWLVGLLASFSAGIHSAYQVETIERLFRRFRQVDPRNTSAGCIKAVSATNELVVMRERLQAGLTARLLELKTEMDKEFGTAFVDIESYLRTEKGIVRFRTISNGRGWRESTERTEQTESYTQRQLLENRPFRGNANLDVVPECPITAAVAHAHKNKISTTTPRPCETSLLACYIIKIHKPYRTQSTAQLVQDLSWSYATSFRCSVDTKVCQGRQ